MLHREREIKGFSRKSLNAPKPNSRYFVPDLSPQDRTALESLRPKVIFVAESPHVSEVEPDEIEARRPLCGMAGRQWWSMLNEILGEGGNSETAKSEVQESNFRGKLSQDVSLPYLIEFCRSNRIVVMNAVQFPLDPKVAKRFPEAEPVKNLGFSKVGGVSSFKKLKTSEPVKFAIHSLKQRLCHPNLAGIPIHCLGNDAEWFVMQAISDPSQCGELQENLLARLGEKIPHPSAWWRQGGLFGRIAREKLMRIFKAQGN